MEIASQIGLKAQKKLHKNHSNRDSQFENYKYMLLFFIILETAHGSNFWSVPSQFQIFQSPDGNSEKLLNSAASPAQPAQLPRFRKECQSYEALPDTSSDIDQLDWWRNHQELSPKPVTFRGGESSSSQQMLAIRSSTRSMQSTRKQGFQEGTNKQTYIKQTDIATYRLNRTRG